MKFWAGVVEWSDICNGTPAFGRVRLPNSIVLAWSSFIPYVALKILSGIIRGFQRVPRINEDLFLFRLNLIPKTHWN